MAIGRNFKESFLKAIRSLEVGLLGLDEIPKISNISKKGIIRLLQQNVPNKFLIIAQAIRKWISIKEIVKTTNYDKWFINEIADLVITEDQIKKTQLNSKLYFRAKSEGFSDEQIVKFKKELTKKS